MDFHKIADKLVKELNGHGLGAYIWHKATTGSAYIRFQDNRLCSIRIGNHPSKKKYEYKFELREDIKKQKDIKSNGKLRHLFPINQPHQLVEAVIKRRDFVSTFTEPSKYQYNIPSFKKPKTMTLIEISYEQVGFVERYESIRIAGKATILPTDNAIQEMEKLRTFVRSALDSALGKKGVQEIPASAKQPIEKPQQTAEIITNLRTPASATPAPTNTASADDEPVF